MFVHTHVCSCVCDKRDLGVFVRVWYTWCFCCVCSCVCDTWNASASARRSGDSCESAERRYEEGEEEVVEEEGELPAKQQSVFVEESWWPE